MAGLIVVKLPSPFIFSNRLKADCFSLSPMISEDFLYILAGIGRGLYIVNLSGDLAKLSVKLNKLLASALFRF